MKSLREVIKEADSKGVAIGHFNISTIEMLHAIAESAEELGVPVIIGVSEKEEDFIGTEEIVSLVGTLRESRGLQIYLNADHHYSMDRVKKAIDAGFDMVIFDGAKESDEENIAIAKECVDYARASGKDVVVEAEIGYIGQSSSLRDGVPDGVVLTDPESAKKFVESTGVDLLAPAVGNIHGMNKDAPEPDLKIDLVREIRDAVGVPLVLHGASGNTNEDIARAIVEGVAVVHVSTELRVAWKDALKEELNESGEVAPYKLLTNAKDAVKNVVMEKLQVFSNPTQYIN